MAEIIIAFRTMNTSNEFNRPTHGDLHFVVIDPPRSMDTHLELLGLLGSAELKLSNSTGKLTIEVVEKKDR